MKAMIQQIKPRVLELYNKGYTCGAIAEELNVCSETVSRARKQLGLPSFKKMPEPTRLAIIELWCKGYKQMAVAQESGVSQSVVSRVIKKWKQGA